MVKFSHGCWHPAPNTLIDWAVEVVKAEARDDHLHFVSASKPINFRGDILNNPTLTHELSSPIDDVLYMSSTHWKGARALTQGPHFELYPDGKSSHAETVKTAKTADSLSLEVGKLRATVDTRPKSFNVDFHAGGKFLTRLGWRSVGYIKHNTTALHPKANYTDPNKGERWTTYQLQLSVGEKIYGLGERFGPLQKNGQTIELWNDDGGTGSELTYKNVPFFLSSNGYGVFIPTSAFVSLEVQSERTTRLNIAVRGEQLAINLIHGPDPKSVLQKYALITGKPALPPAWTFGLWLSTSFTTEYDEATVNSFLNGMRERDIPVSVFHFDCFWMKGFEWCDFEFDKDMFPDAKGQLARIKERGQRICVWINPYIAQESKIFDEGAEKGYFIKRKSDGAPFQYDFWQAGMGFVDFTNPDACKWFQSKLQKLIDMGVDSFKTDFGERIPTGDVAYFDGSDPDRMHNYYAYLYNKVTFEVLERNYGKDRAALFARSATAGCQQFPVHWGGDPYSTYEAMAETLRGGLSLALCGFGYWAHDIGGFEGKPDPGLFKRWIAFGLLSSHSRLHGSGSFRVPWLIDESGEADKVLQKFVGFKQSLMPYLFSQAIQTHKTGVPMLRATFLEYPDDPVSWSLDTQYFLGDSVLVAPVFNNEGNVTYYVPEGEFYSLLDGKIRHGPKYFTEQHDYFSLPVLLRPGSAIALGKAEGETVYDWSNGVKLVVNHTPDLDKTVEIPNHTRPGEIVASLRVRGTEEGLTVDVSTGKLASDWELSVVNKSVKNVSVDGKEQSAKGSTVAVKSPAKTVKVSF
ncbi:alpha-D-xyloside xylohydrolase [Capronia epimyces CBS 606.96]|uniref:alpha-D-xyloside xylohydrolase n=1 Tax=Capronia epimyces CBS 606.96 TaxID=1182542 RepID=W9YU61_9EURO|nr:alpha-D-xyloside xylohydrolase [Capronia epimyces CBS 606.96]EXJ92806.1 alpha-D-xyloside xylohydrolase [Capronia epimyces CBS 606.96]